VSDLGRVRCWRPVNNVAKAPAEPRIKQPEVNRLGYKRVTMYCGDAGVRRPVHQLVLEAFVGPCPPGHEARHVDDRDPGNNALSNLAWGTHRENCDDRTRHGTSNLGKTITFKKPRALARGKAHGSYTHPGGRDKKLTPAQALEIRARYQRGVNSGVLAAEFGVSKRTVWLIGTGQSRTRFAQEEGVL
jgi:hypothetical protein